MHSGIRWAAQARHVHGGIVQGHKPGADRPNRRRQFPRQKRFHRRSECAGREYRLEARPNRYRHGISWAPTACVPAYLLANLRGAGIDPASIDVVASQPRSPGRCLGARQRRRQAELPNAQIHITQADLEYWTDEAKLSNPALGHYIGPTCDALLPWRDRMAFLKDGQEFISGMQALSTPGHTVGHTSFVINSQDSAIVYTGDLGHQPLLQMENRRAESPATPIRSRGCRLGCAYST